MGFGVVIVAVLAFAYYVFFLPNYYNDTKGQLVTISRGESFRMVADSLANTGAIRNTWSFELAGRMMSSICSHVAFVGFKLPI